MGSGVAVGMAANCSWTWLVIVAWRSGVGPGEGLVQAVKTAAVRVRTSKWKRTRIVEPPCSLGCVALAEATNKPCVGSKGARKRARASPRNTQGPNNGIPRAGSLQRADYTTGRRQGGGVIMSRGASAPRSRTPSAGRKRPPPVGNYGGGLVRSGGHRGCR